MNQIITLDENDFITQLLFSASKSKRIKYKRKRGWLILVIGALCFGCLFLSTGNTFGEYYSFAAAIVFLIFYPLYERWYYKRHYTKFVKETYKNRIGIPCEMELDNKLITTSDKTGEAKLNISEIEEIYEIADYIFIKFKINSSLIIPKAKVEKSFIEKIENIAHLQSIPILKELDWHWK
jgi:hypothetical protein